MRQIHLLLLISILTFGCFERKPNIIKTGFEGKPMPQFNFLLMDSLTNVNTTKIPEGMPIVVFYFSPLCHYCKTQTKEIIKNAQTFNNFRFYLLSNFPFEMIKGYYKQFNLKNYPNLTVGHDFDYNFNDYYKIPGVPYIAVYDYKKTLKKVFLGNTSAQTIKETAFN